MKRILGLVALAIWGATASAAPVMTRFDPKVHGFNFVNNFVDDEIDILDVRRSGFCAGMAYNALDYYKSGKLTPRQWWTPNRGSPLERQILGRHKTANFGNADRLAELEINPGGARDGEFYEWGISARISELRASIDAGNPVPIFLRGLGNGHHEVLAIGYDMGRYLGDLKGAVSDFTIFAYDPNYPGEITQIKPNPAGRHFVYAAPRAARDSGAKWLTWASDTKYVYKAPGTMPHLDFVGDNKVSGLLFRFGTGPDDLRGGKDGGSSYIGLKVKTTDGKDYSLPRASLGQRWLSNVEQEVFMPLVPKINPGLIASIEVIHTTEGGLSPDNWTMSSMSVEEVGKKSDGAYFFNSLVRRGQHRFDGDHRSLPIQLAVTPLPAHTNELFLTFRTDGDDLRGEFDNCNVKLNFTDGRNQIFTNVNQRVQWNNYTTNIVNLRLLLDRRPEDIISVELTKSTIPTGADNWTMGYFLAEYSMNGARVPLALWGQNRFTHEKRRLTVPCQTRFAEDKSSLLHFIFGTGGDDLRGGNDNLKIKVTLKSGRTEVFPYVNQGVPWNNERRSDVTVMMSEPVSAADIASVELEVDRGGDNWNMNSVEVWIRPKGNPIQVLRSGAHRFTGDAYKLTLRP